MSAETPAPRERASTQTDPTREEKAEYFKSLGLRMRPELKLLAEEPFRVGGVQAKKEGWFVAYRAIVQAAVAATLSDMIGLPADEKRVLTEAATLNEVMRRVQYARKPARETTSADRAATDAEGREILLARGVDPRAVAITRSNDTMFTRESETGRIAPKTPEEEETYRMQRFLNYIHNCIDIKITTDADGHKTHAVDITDWRAHLTDAAKRYTEIAEEAEVVDGEKRTFFELEADLMEKTEREIAERIRAAHPDRTDLDKKPLWQFLREEVMDDIRQGVHHW